MCLDSCFHCSWLFDTSHSELKAEESYDKSTIHAKIGSADEIGNNSGMKWNSNKTEVIYVTYNLRH